MADQPNTLQKMFPNWGVCDFKLPGGGPQPPPVRIYPPLSLLINFGNRQSAVVSPLRMDEIETNECNDTQWNSPNVSGLSRPIQRLYLGMGSTHSCLTSLIYTSFNTHICSNSLVVT